MSTGETIIRVGHSPDSDDAFMFHALTNGKIDTDGLRFVHQLEDIQTLNKRALAGELEVSAISIHAFAYVADKYALMSSGASMGEGYGPKIVTREPTTVEGLKGKTIAVPGAMTSAFLALRLALGKDVPVVQMDFDAVLPAVLSGEVAAGVIIHEGQLYYREKGLHQVLDLGVWWNERTGGLPLPLGGNVVRRDLGDALIEKIASLVKRSVQYALDHRQEALDYALTYARDLDPALADEFVGMYVNQRTVDYGPEGRKAVQSFLDQGAEMGLVPGPLAIQFVG